MKKLYGLNQEINITDQAQLTHKNSQNKYVGRFCYERTTGDRLFHWKKRYYGLWTSFLPNSYRLKLKLLICFTSQDVNWWTGVNWNIGALLVNYVDACISCLDSHSDGTHSQQQTHCYDVMLHFSKYVPKKQTNIESIEWLENVSFNVDSAPWTATRAPFLLQFAIVASPSILHIIVCNMDITAN